MRPFPSVVSSRFHRFVLGLTIVVALLVTLRQPARAATAADSTLVPHRGRETATLRLGNRDIAEFRADFLGYRPAERATLAQGRLRHIVMSLGRRAQQTTVDMRQTDVGWLYMVDGRMVFTLTAADVDTLGDETIAGVMEQTRRKLDEAVTASLEQRSPARLMRSILFSVLATLVLFVLFRSLSRAGKWINRRLSGAMERRTEHLNLPPSVHAGQLNNMLRGVIRVVAVLLALVLIDIWLTFVLKQFPYTYPWGDQIDDYLFAALASIGLAILHSIPNLLMLVLIFVIARFVTRWLGLLFDAAREGRFSIPGVDEETALPAKRLTTLFLWILTFALAYPFIPGSQGVAFKGVSVLLGVMLSLGSSNVLSQAASGYMLMFSKALRVNDYIRIGEHEGTVMSIGVLSTKIRTPRDEEINVPNTVIVGTTTKNYTRLNRDLGAPVTTTITIGYNAPWRQVHAMMKDAASRTEGLRTAPEPVVLQSALSDFYVEYTLFARLDTANTRTRVLSRLHANIQDLFNEYGVQIMSPHYEGDPEGKVWVPKEKWHESPADAEKKG